MRQPSEPPGQSWQDDVVLPLLDRAVLERLLEEFDDDDSLWKIFVSDFIAYAPTRIERLRQALTTGDLTGSLDAVLSLKTSSQMVGAERLAGLALNLEQTLRAELEMDADRVLPWLAVTHLQPIERCSRQTIGQLYKYMGRNS